MKVYICGKGCCPAVEILDNEVIIGEEDNICRLSKEEWNKLVDMILSGKLTKII
ncbi:hypothetical protein HRbin06_00742 [archaeon HR06]|nr:hypothetical protein HRbin06_00742 [archaeon HR06]